MSDNCFIKFKGSTNNILLPERFTFPFYYQPHPISIMAATELQQYLEQQNFNHNFGLLDPAEASIGKMFGVLVVKNNNNELGYLAAFSGKLGDSNHHKHFVPPVYDILKENGLYKSAERELNKINLTIDNLENNAKYNAQLNELAILKKEAEADISAEKLRLKEKRSKRRNHFNATKDTLTNKQIEEYQQKSSQEGINTRFYLNELKLHWDNKITALEKNIIPTKSKIEQLKKYRKEKSAKTQQQLFLDYNFLNKNQEEKNLLEIFTEYAPPAGSGECAAPKLLQYAYLHNLTPISLAEFWWGIPPKSEIRKHKQFYPSCIGKCKPILNHMLQGLDVEDNPLIVNQASEKKIEYLYEDNDIIIINKPNELLSVPGKVIKDSVYTRVIKKYKLITGPVIVHRLDMSTSGIMILAKSKSAYKILQQQFINRSIKKKYIAILNGIPSSNEGKISLPLRLDIYDRPKQLVCYKHGKSAETYWKTIETKNNKTRIELFPITGRTHQLRIHCAHIKGLNVPILGDDLYGIKKNRLHLHAEELTFNHPSTNKRMTFIAKAPF